MGTNELEMEDDGFRRQPDTAPPTWERIRKDKTMVIQSDTEETPIITIDWGPQCDVTFDPRGVVEMNGGKLRVYAQTGGARVLLDEVTLTDAVTSVKSQVNMGCDQYVITALLGSPRAANPTYCYCVAVVHSTVRQGGAEPPGPDVSDAEFVTLADDADLPNARRLIVGSGLSADVSTPGELTLTATASPTETITASGTVAGAVRFTPQAICSVDLAAYPAGTAARVRFLGSMLDSFGERMIREQYFGVVRWPTDWEITTGDVQVMGWYNSTTGDAFQGNNWTFSFAGTVLTAYTSVGASHHGPVDYKGLMFIELI